MAKIDDIELFVRVVKAGGLAAAGRQVGLSPAAVTARINKIESRYKTRLLNRSTRSVTLTSAGRGFYDACLPIVEQLHEAEASLRQQDLVLAGQLRVTATSDFGRQFVAPAIQQFSLCHPELKVSLHISDGLINLVEQGFDLGIRYGNLQDSQLVSKKLADNRRVLCAAPPYLEKYGTPKRPAQLLQHRCLVMERMGEPLNEWHFNEAEKKPAIASMP